MRAKAIGVCVLVSMAVGCSAAPEGPPNPGVAPIDAGAGEAGPISPWADASANDAGSEAGVDASLDVADDHAIDEAEDAAADVAVDGEEELDADVDASPEPDASEGDAEPDADEEDASEDAPVDDAGEEGGEGEDAGNEPDGGLAIPDEPTCLEEAGLYADFATRELAPGIRFYKPAFELWSDGAHKERHVFFPEGSTIDTSDPDGWIFPVGSRFYKTFRIDGRPIETRFLQKLEDRWFVATYAWNADGTATARVTLGVRNALGTQFDIPDQTTCKGCHNGAADMAVGFELFGLAYEGAQGLTLDVMNHEGLLSPPLLGDYRIPGDVTTQLALGWLHANCGTGCHNHRPTSKGYWSGFHVHLHTQELGSVHETATFRTGVGVLSTFQPGGPTLYRLAPGNPDRSAVIYRISRRGTTEQMPPMATEIVDEAGIATLRAFIESL